MKIGILGTGMIVKALMKTVDKLHFSRAALLGTKETEEETKSMCREYGLDGYYLDYEELLESDVDTIYVALPNHLHYGFAKKALLAGKHVILEKPGTSNAAQMRELERLAAQEKKMLLEAMNIHYLPVFQSLKEHLKDLGTIKIVSLNYSQYSSRYDAFKRGEVLAAFDPKRAGGALMDLNVYNIHAAVGLFGKPESVRYEANVEREIDTSGILTMDYGSFKVSSIGAKDCKAPVRCTIQGTEGCIVIAKPVNQMESFELILNDGRTEEFRTENPEHRLYYEFVEFERMIREEDWESQNRMLAVSRTAAEILEEGRRQNGIFTDFAL